MRAQLSLGTCFVQLKMDGLRISGFPRVLCWPLSSLLHLWRRHLSKFSSGVGRLGTLPGQVPKTKTSKKGTSRFSWKFGVMWHAPGAEAFLLFIKHFREWNWLIDWLMISDWLILDPTDGLILAVETSDFLWFGLHVQPTLIIKFGKSRISISKRFYDFPCSQIFRCSTSIKNSCDLERHFGIFAWK